MFRSQAVFFILFGIFINCSGSSDSAIPENPVHEGAVTLEITFGDDEVGLPSEHIIASPRAVGVSINNEILVLDEEKIKVFNPDGTAKTIIGGPGQGPGEFERGYRLFVGPTGYISVKNISATSLISPEYEFISKRNYNHNPYYNQLKEENNWDGGLSLYSIFTSENERIVSIMGNETVGSSYRPTEHNALVHEKDGESSTVVIFTKEYEDTYIMKMGQGSLSMSQRIEFLGSLVWTVLPGRKLVYINTGKDYVDGENNGTYNMHIYDIETKTEQILSHEFDFVSFDNVELPQKRDLSGIGDQAEYNQAEFDKFIENIHEYADRLGHCVPLQALLNDGKYLFAFTYKTNEQEEIFTDVFDMEAGEYICSTYFPKLPRTIANGYAYSTYRADEESFTVIAKYRIDPVVYGK
ncbi:hypothetical protein ACFL67_00080 [candidate division KSB1 bacterium]